MRDEHDRDTRVIGQDTLEASAPSTGAPPIAPPGYELLRRIGRGGGGAVYLARDVTLDRPVAVKFLAGAGPAEVERFRREARLAARLNDPAIVQVYELGDAGGQPYIAMQFVDGGNLAQVDLDTTALIRAVREIALALRHAHREGIVHRDIKPENILLDGERRAYLTDFGIARSLHNAMGETMSAEGQIMGTPAVMPPEQARGDVQAIDARSDIYALGATLYYKVAGRYPFERASVVEVLHAAIHDPVPLPRSFNTAVPRGLEAIIIRCMQKSREDRYQGVGALIEDFDRLTAGRPVGRESAAWFRQLVTEREALPPVEETGPMSSDPHGTTGLEIIRAIAAWDVDLYRVSGSLKRSFDRLDAVRERLEAILEERPDAAWARFHRGTVLRRRGRLGEALEEMERSIDRVENRAGAYFELGRLYLALYLRQHHQARQHLSRTGVESNLRAARRRLDQAVVALREAHRLRGELPPWHEAYAAAVARLAEDDPRGCVAARDEILGAEPDLEEVWKLRGDALDLAGESPFESYDRALAARRSYFEALYSRAEAHVSRGQYPKARAALERALEIHPEFTAAAALLGRTDLTCARDDDEADPAACLSRGHRAVAKALAESPNEYDLAVTLAELTIERGRQDRCEAALAESETLLARCRELPGCQNRVNMLTARLGLERARLAARQGREARHAYDAVIETCRTDEGALAGDSDDWLAIRDAARRERDALDG